MAAGLLTIGGFILVCTCITVPPALLLVGLFGIDAARQLAQFPIPWLLSAALFAEGIRQLWAGWFVRNADLAAVSRAAITRGIVVVSSSIAAGLAKLDSAGLIGASVLGAWTGIGILVRQSGQHFWWSFRLISWRRLRVGLARHGKNASWSTIVSIANSLSLSAPLLVLADFYTPREVGWYALMHRLMAAPIGVLTSAMSQSFWSEAAEYARTNRIAELHQFYLKTTRRLAVACIPVAIICLLGRAIVGPALGRDEWEGAGDVLVVMIPLFVGWVLISPTNHLVTLGRQRFQLIADVSRLVFVTGSIGLAHHWGYGFVVAVGASSLSSLLGHMILFFLHLKAHRQALSQQDTRRNSAV